MIGPVPHWWNWKLSARCRLLSLVTLWLSLAFLSSPGGVMVVLMAGRTVASVGQTWLNVALGRKEPLAPARRLDWSLTALTVGGAYFAAIGHQMWAAPITLPLLLPAMAPLTVLQLLMVRRAQVQQRTVDARTQAMGRIVRFTRAERAA